MKKFTEWLNETHYSFGNTKPASEWREKWFNIARNYIKKKTEDGDQHIAHASIWRINQVANKLQALHDEPLTLNQVALMAGDEESGDQELDAHFEELIDALERFE